MARSELYALVWQEPMTKLAKRFKFSNVGSGKSVPSTESDTTAWVRFNRAGASPESANQVSLYIAVSRVTERQWLGMATWSQHEISELPGPRTLRSDSHAGCGRGHSRLSRRDG